MPLLRHPCFNRRCSNAVLRVTLVTEDEDRVIVLTICDVCWTPYGVRIGPGPEPKVSKSSLLAWRDLPPHFDILKDSGWRIVWEPTDEQ